MNSSRKLEVTTSPTEPFHGATLAIANAKELHREATILRTHGARSRAYFLYQISMEECAKAEMLGTWAVSLLAGDSLQSAKILSAMANHKAKNFINAYMLPAGELEQAMREKGDWDAALAAFKRMQAEFHSRSNERKNASLYVDFADNAFRPPSDRITDVMVDEISKLNASFIESCGPPLRYLAKALKDPAGSGKMLQSFMTRIEELREGCSADPGKLLDIVMTELYELHEARSRELPKTDV